MGARPGIGGPARQASPDQVLQPQLQLDRLERRAPLVQGCARAPGAQLRHRHRRHPQQLRDGARSTHHLPLLSRLLRLRSLAGAAAVRSGPRRGVARRGRLDRPRRRRSPRQGRRPLPLHLPDQCGLDLPRQADALHAAGAAQARNRDGGAQGRLGPLHAAHRRAPIRRHLAPLGKQRRGAGSLRDLALVAIEGGEQLHLLQRPEGRRADRGRANHHGRCAPQPALSQHGPPPLRRGALHFPLQPAFPGRRARRRARAAAVGRLVRSAGRVARAPTMMRAVAKRIVLMAPTLLGIALIAFAVVRAMPGDPLAAQGDGALQAGGAPLAQMSAYRRQMGVDDPLLPGFARWLLRLVTGDLGSSFRDGRAVSAVLGEALPMTLLLSIPSLLIGYLVAIGAGILSAARPDGPVDRALSWLAFFVYSLPVQWIALMAIVGVSGGGWPIQGWNGPRSLLLPVVCLSYAPAAVLARFLRSSMLEQLGPDYVRTARA